MYVGYCGKLSLVRERGLVVVSSGGKKKFNWHLSAALSLAEPNWHLNAVLSLAEPNWYQTI